MQLGSDPARSGTNELRRGSKPLTAFLWYDLTSMMQASFSQRFFRHCIWYNESNNKMAGTINFFSETIRIQTLDFEPALEASRQLSSLRLVSQSDFNRSPTRSRSMQMLRKMPAARGIKVQSWIELKKQCCSFYTSPSIS